MQNHILHDAFMQLVRFSMGIDSAAPAGLTAQQWQTMYSLAADHALLGVCADGIERLAADQRPPMAIALKWASATLQIEKSNRRLNERCCQIVDILGREGLRSCILKGQGAAMTYPNPLRRQCGDIDVWVSGGHKEVVAMVRKRFPKMGARYHHIDYPIFSDTEVEIHYRPSWLTSPRDNSRLQAWFAAEAPTQFANVQVLPGNVGSVAMPTPQFNMVYMATHIYNHLFDEGIGLRQLMDYYYMLRRFMATSTPADRQAVVATLKRVGLLGFVRALMFVMREAFHATPDMLFVEPKEAVGRYIMDEVMRSGNFGTASTDIDRSQGKSASYFATKLRYKLHYCRHYPVKTFWNNAFWVWQFFWRLRHGYIKM